MLLKCLLRKKISGFVQYTRILEHKCANYGKSQEHWTIPESLFRNIAFNSIRSI